MGKLSNFALNGGGKKQQNKTMNAEWRESKGDLLKPKNIPLEPTKIDGSAKSPFKKK